MTVKTILCRKGRDVVTIEPSATLESAIATLAEHRIGALVVLGAEQRVIGILSERDVVRTFAEFGADALTKRLAQVMTREVVSIGPDASILEAVRLMLQHKISGLPVVDAAGRPSGTSPGTSRRSSSRCSAGASVSRNGTSCSPWATPRR